MNKFVLVYPNIIFKGIYKDIIKGVAVPPQGICRTGIFLNISKTDLQFLSFY
jgi:hypothetical protein|tara:strand:+ start:321 stop:476 length:156 start_codon:yes stop_codon:yes gene_type:complete